VAVVFIAPVKFPNIWHSSISQPLINLKINPALKLSPAPIASTTLSFKKDFLNSLLPFAATIEPLLPSFTTTYFVYLANLLIAFSNTF
jgi:hypothetical protein